ncbi:MAG: Ig-like domain-containing protein [Bacteroidota bacterium]
MLAGEFDRLAPPSAVDDLYEAIGSTNKLMLTLIKTAHSVYWERRSLDVPTLCLDWLEDGSMDDHTEGIGLYKLNDTFDWIGEFDEGQAPVVVRTFPAHLGEEVSLDIDLVIELDEAVFDLKEYLTIFRKHDNSVFQYIALDSSPRVVQTCQNIITVDIDTLETQTEYYVYIHFDAFRDRSLNTFEGLLTDKQWRFSTGKLLTSQTPNLSISPQMVFPNPSTGRIYFQSTIGRPRIGPCRWAREQRPSMFPAFLNTGQALPQKKGSRVNWYMLVNG